MPMIAPRVCACNLTVAAGQLCPCQQRRKIEADKVRGSARARGYDTRWERESKAFLALPVNRKCFCGCGRDADMVHHAVAHKGDQGLFWSRSNWKPANRRCNARIAAATEGGFGNPAERMVPREHHSLPLKDRVLM